MTHKKIYTNDEVKMFQAIEAQDYKKLNECFQAGVNLNVRNTEGETPLMVLCKAIKTNEDQNNALFWVNHIIQCSANLDMCDYKGKTALHHLADKVWTDKIVRTLLENNANPNIQDYDSHTPLHIAVQKGCQSIIYSLVENNANPNIQDCDGYTPLHIAAQHGNGQNIQVLYKYGANPTLINSMMNQPQHLAGSKYAIMILQSITQDFLSRRIESKVEKMETKLDTIQATLAMQKKAPEATFAVHFSGTKTPVEYHIESGISRTK